eukprot:5193898-Pleurochrysis_carterae.AAC.1
MAASTTDSPGGGANVRRRHATSVEGEAIAKLTTASLRFSSISFMTHAVRTISPGAHTTTCLIAFVARSNAGSKSTRDT